MMDPNQTKLIQAFQAALDELIDRYLLDGLEPLNVSFVLSDVFDSDFDIRLGDLREAERKADEREARDGRP